MMHVTIVARNWLECEIQPVSRFFISPHSRVLHVRQLVHVLMPSLDMQMLDDCAKVEVEFFIPGHLNVPVHDEMLLTDICLVDSHCLPYRVCLLAELVRRSLRRS